MPIAKKNMARWPQYQTTCVACMLSFDNKARGIIEKPRKNMGHVTPDPGLLNWYMKDFSITIGGNGKKPLKSRPRDWWRDAIRKRLGTKEGWGYEDYYFVFFVMRISFLYKLF